MPTVLVEGSTDASIYRIVAKRMGLVVGTFLPCGGRTVLLEVFRRRFEIVNTVAIAFVADRDMWLFDGMPSGLDEVIFTSGYSIENDVLHGGVAESLFEENEKEEFESIISELIKWFAFEVEEYVNGRAPKVAEPIDKIIPKGSTKLSQDFLDKRGYATPDASIHSKIKAEYKTLLRGKHLLDAFHRILYRTNRMSRFDKENILELSIKIQPHTMIDKLAADIVNVIKRDDNEDTLAQQLIRMYPQP